jgi:hypothetical protein
MLPDVSQQSDVLCRTGVPPQKGFEPLKREAIADGENT